MEPFLLALPNPPPEEKPSSPFGGESFIFIIVILFAMMLLMPLLSKKERKRQKRLQALKKHDRVVTSGGLFGTVISFDDQTATLEVAKGVRLTFKRSSVYDIEGAEGATPQEAPEKQAGAKG